MDDDKQSCKVTHIVLLTYQQKQKLLSILWYNVYVKKELKSDALNIGSKGQHDLRKTIIQMLKDGKNGSELKANAKSLGLSVLCSVHYHLFFLSTIHSVCSKRITILGEQ